MVLLPFPLHSGQGMFLAQEARFWDTRDTLSLWGSIVYQGLTAQSCPGGKPCLLRTYPEIVILYFEDFLGQCIDQMPSLEYIFSLSGPLNHRKFPPFPRPPPPPIFSCFKKLGFLSLFLFQLPVPCLPSHHQHPSLLLLGWGAVRPLPQSSVGLVLILIVKNILSHTYCFFFLIGKATCLS